MPLMRLYIFRHALPFVPVLNCVFVFISTNRDGIFCKALVCITSMLAALLVDGVSETLFVFFWLLILSVMLCRPSEIAQINGLVCSKLATVSDRIRLSHPEHRASSSCGEVMEPPIAIRLHALYSGMLIDVATSNLLKHSYPTKMDDPISTLIGAMCWESFVAKFVPVVDATCTPITSLIENVDAAPLEVNININVRNYMMYKYMNPRRRVKYWINHPGQEKTDILRALCDVLVATGNFVKTASDEHTRTKMTHCVLRVPASKLNTKRDALANVFVNDPFVEWQDVLDSMCRSLGTREAQLAFFVRRWARERGIACARSGHLSPFTWTLLVLHFLGHRSSRDEEQSDAGSVVVDWFGEFLSFYTDRFLHCQESISISIDSDDLDANTRARGCQLCGTCVLCSLHL
eukprot:TRINITY_DN10802_c0_g5_i2.p1 TRINITY_DN10802_c0_g5~~TRINITY_DN10802_c0_g5_i2.p1  ORF type:complete len:405 (-),score=27.02 TRINITY_DN10802_c0_g5_i2:63-1277(-)